ncbi:hypothetical protein [Peribacillus sp. SCS-155]|uniref:hypothetical protein n=1 Tax=Peribacillus sedimenti TaxID=3115297 RepID=UPI003906D0A8
MANRESLYEELEAQMKDMMQMTLELAERYEAEANGYKEELEACKKQIEDLLPKAKEAERLNKKEAYVKRSGTITNKWLAVKAFIKMR